MGQRHQIFCFVNGPKDQVYQIAFHNQWCYGSLPLRHLKRVIQFQTHTDKYICLGSDYSLEATAEKLQTILSCDPCSGFFSHYTPITDEVMEGDEKSMHPERGDNNDGITVIHIKGKKIKYCFMNISEGGEMGTPPRLPLSAEEYIKLYYDASSKEWKDFRINRLLSFINRRTKVLSVLQCMKLFPTFYNEKEKAAARASNNELPLHMDQNNEVINQIVATRLKEAV